MCWGIPALTLTLPTFLFSVLIYDVLRLHDYFFCDPGCDFEKSLDSACLVRHFLVPCRCHNRLIANYQRSKAFRQREIALEARTFVLALRGRQQFAELPQSLAPGFPRLAFGQPCSRSQGSHYGLDHFANEQRPFSKDVRTQTCSH